MLWGDKGDQEEEPHEEEDQVAGRQPPMEVLSSHPRVTRSRPIGDPFEALFAAIREHGKSESVEIKSGGMALKFNTLAIQHNLPLIVLMVDAKAISLDMAPESDIMLKVRGKSYPSRFVVGMPFSGHVNLLFFITEDQTTLEHDQDR